MKKVFNSDLHLRIRTNLMNGVRDASCLRCWQTEENGAESYRTIWNNIDQIDKILLREWGVVNIDDRGSLFDSLANLRKSQLYKPQMEGENNETYHSNNV